MAASDAIPVPRKNTAFRLYFAVRNVTNGALITSWTGADSEVSLDGASFADCTNEATEIGTSGCGYIDLTASEMNADAVVYKLTLTNTNAQTLVVTLFPEESGDYRAAVTDKTGFSLSQAFPTNFASLAITGAGAVTAGTVSDKTGYSLSQTFPTNFASMAITGAGAVTAGTVSDKTGYSLTQSFPSNFASLAITGAGAVTAGTVSDKTGYSLSQAFPTNFASMAISGAGAVTAGTVSDKTGYSLATAPLDAAGVRSAVGLASANLDTQLSTLTTYVDTLETEVGKVIKTGQQFTATDGVGSKNVTFTRI